jgi:single-stranded DNA-specific DHH superfamily exonuclease
MGMPKKAALLVHHGDADGVCAAAVVRLALERQGWKIEKVCLEKLFPEVLGKIHSREVSAIIYIDLGSPHVDEISKANQGRKLVVILDYHDPTATQDPSILNLNPEFWGMNEESDASSSTVAYLLAVDLSELNEDSAPIALVGSSELPGKVAGLNRMPLEVGLKNGAAQMARSGKSEVVKVRIGNEWWNRQKASSLITALGSVGYYRGGPDIAIDAITTGIEERTKRLAEQLEEERRSKFEELFSDIRRHALKSVGLVQWIDLENRLAGMGTKVIGTFLSVLRFKRIVDPKKYLLGFMWLEPKIPGIGTLAGDWTKVSARAPPVLNEAIASGTMPPLSQLLRSASDAVGGFADGHAYAASGVIPRGSEPSFVERVNELASRPREHTEDEWPIKP